MILAFDTSTAHLVVALGRGREAAASLEVSAPRAALGALLPAVGDLLGRVKAEPRDVRAVVVGRGPGSFTGVRIAVATAKGMAQGLGAPLFGVGTLDAVARRHATHEGLVGVVGDAMRREVYPALFRAGGGRIERLGDDRVCSPAAAAEEWAALGEPVLLAGDGLAKYREVFEAALGGRATVAPPETWPPAGWALLAEAWDAHGEALEDAMAGQAVPWAHPGGLLPVYTRLSDAEEAEAIRAGRTPGNGVAGPGGAR